MQFPSISNQIKGYCMRLHAKALRSRGRCEICFEHPPYKNPGKTRNHYKWLTNFPDPKFLPWQDSTEFHSRLLPSKTLDPQPLLEVQTQHSLCLQLLPILVSLPEVVHWWTPSLKAWNLTYKSHSTFIVHYKQVFQTQEYLKVLTFPYFSNKLSPAHQTKR